MTLNDFIGVCEKNNLQAEEWSKNWYIANIKSKFINATWIICYCTTDEKLYYRKTLVLMVKQLLMMELLYTMKLISNVSLKLLEN